MISTTLVAYKKQFNINNALLEKNFTFSRPLFLSKDITKMADKLENMVAYWFSSKFLDPFWNFYLSLSNNVSSGCNFQRLNKIKNSMMLKMCKWFSVNIYALMVDRWCCPLGRNSLFLALKQSTICDRSNWSKTVDEGKEQRESKWYTRDSGSVHANLTQSKHFNNQERKFLGRVTSLNYCQNPIFGVLTRGVCYI